MKKTRLLILFLFLASLACGGIGLTYEHDLTADYAVWATDVLEQKETFSYARLFPSFVP